MKKQILLSAVLACISVFSAAAQKEPVDYVNPFVGTTNYGTTNPGALTPHGMMSVTPFNVMGVPEGDKDKDKQWWSTPYEFNNKYLTMSDFYPNFKKLQNHDCRGLSTIWRCKSNDPGTSISSDIIHWSVYRSNQRSQTFYQR